MERKVKGTHVINIINYVKSKKGELGLQKMWDRMEDKVDVLQKEYHETEWVEYNTVQKFFETIEEIFEDTIQDVPRSRDIGRHISENLGHLEYLTLASGLREMVDKAIDGWDRVYNFGRLELAEWDEEGNKAVIRYHGFPADRNVCHYFQGSLEKDLELLGLDGDVEHTACPVDGDDYMEFTLTW